MQPNCVSFWEPWLRCFADVRLEALMLLVSRMRTEEIAFRLIKNDCLWLAFHFNFFSSIPDQRLSWTLPVYRFYRCPHILRLGFWGTTVLVRTSWNCPPSLQNRISLKVLIQNQLTPLRLRVFHDVCPTQLNLRDSLLLGLTRLCGEVYFWQLSATFSFACS